MVRSLSEVDPRTAWESAPAERWNRNWAAHLFRRAAFGFPPKDDDPKATNWQRLNAAVERGRDAAIDSLFVTAGDPLGDVMDDLGRRIAVANSEDLGRLQGWWLYRMLHSRDPLRERMTLFWHNHFATSNAKVRSQQMMFEQNRLLREHALGPFGPLLQAIGRDAAMLVWLDGRANVAGKPNENYAREVMELFALGVGNYSERDIREAARALTGWTVRNGKARFDAERHDAGEKSIFGTSGAWRDDDVVRLLLEQPATGRRLARKLFKQFVSEAESPSDELIEPLAETLRTNNYDIAATLRTIFASNLFNSEVAWRARIKSPAEYVVTMLTALDASPPVEGLAGSMQGLGQSLFAPPNVKGWDGGQAWLNTATLLARHNLAWRLVGGEHETYRKHVRIATFADKHGAKTLAAASVLLLDVFVDGDVAEQGREQLDRWRAKRSEDDRGMDSPLWPALAHTILTMPEYQLA